jgi:hypothetical protein
MREVVYSLPSHSLTGHGEATEWREQVPDGATGDVWRCVCRGLWRVGQFCDVCDRYGVRSGVCPRGGYHATGLAWRPARWWQRLLRRGGT